jgi:hypothetical protein
MADPFTGWAIVELLGRRRIAGYVTADAPLLQATRLQVDIYPGDDTTSAATQFTSYPVYCLTPCTEALARQVGEQAIRYEMPVAQWQLPAAIEPPDDVVDIVIHSPDCGLGPDCDGECGGGDSEGAHDELPCGGGDSEGAHTMNFHDVIRHLVAHCPFSDEAQAAALAAVDEHEVATGQLPADAGRDEAPELRLADPPWADNRPTAGGAGEPQGSSTPGDPS